METRDSEVSLFDRRLWLFHGAYLAVGAALLAAPPQVPLGWRIFFAGVLYNVALPVFASRCVEPRWIHMWSFLLPLSVMQILPDWYLAAELGTLEFPDLGFPMVGPVSGFMALLWIAPLFLVVDWGERLAGRYGHGLAALGAGALSLGLFAGAEATLPLVPIWHPVNVEVAIGPVAVYVLVPEALLGASAWAAYAFSRRRSLFVRLLSAGAVAFGYILTLHLSHFLIEG